MTRSHRLLALLRRLELVPPRLDALERRVDDLAVLHGTSLVHELGGVRELRDTEFKVFSQFGEDGVIQYLIRSIEVQPELETFVEIGVENYTESNTRFLLRHDNWRGLVVDGGAAHIAHIRADTISWQHDLTAVHAFVTRDNLMEILARHGFDGELGLLSLDVDGIDYWLLDQLTARPLVLVLEYNAVFGSRAAVTVPYREDFRRADAHWSHLYWGASLRALWIAADRLGYDLVYCNRAGNNAFFVRRDRLGDLRALTPEEAYVNSRFRDSRNEQGELSFVGGAARRELIGDLPVVDVETGRTLRLRDVPND